MKKDLLTKIALLLLLTSILAGCAGLQAKPPALPPLRVEFTQWWGDYTLLVAQEKGFFEKYGVQVEPVYYDVFADTYPDLASGQIDGALIAVGDTININRSSEMKVVAIHDNGGEDAIVVPPDIKSIQELRGKAIGIQVGSQYELTIAEMLRSVNMDVGDVTIVDINPEDALSALDSKQVQAAYIWEPYLSEALLKGNKVIYPQEQTYLFPDLIVFSKSIVDKRPDEIRAFLRAWFEAVDYRLQNPEETRAIAAKYFGVPIAEVPADENLKILTLEDNRALFNIQEANSIYSITKITSDYLISIGVVTEEVDPLELLDPGYLP